MESRGMRCSSMPWQPSKLFESKDSYTFCLVELAWVYLQIGITSNNPPCHVYFLFFNGVFLKLIFVFTLNYFFYIFILFFQIKKIFKKKQSLIRKNLYTSSWFVYFPVCIDFWLRSLMEPRPNLTSNHH